MAPADVHDGYVEVITERPAQTLQKAYEQHPECFGAKIPRPPRLVHKVWIIKPSEDVPKADPWMPGIEEVPFTTVR